VVEVRVQGAGRNSRSSRFTASGALVGIQWPPSTRSYRQGPSTYPPDPRICASPTNSSPDDQIPSVGQRTRGAAGNSGTTYLSGLMFARYQLIAAVSAPG